MDMAKALRRTVFQAALGLAIGALIVSVSACAADNGNGWDSITKKVDAGQVEVVLDEIPYPTDQYTRIGYSLKTWEFEKDDLTLKRIIVKDAQMSGVLLELYDATLPYCFKDGSLSGAPYDYDKLLNYYLSIQVPIPLGRPLPRMISHTLVFYNTVQKCEVVIEGGTFSPRVNETPVRIASPVRGSNLVFWHQSNGTYHFDALTFSFTDRTILHGQRFAIDALRFNDDLDSYFSGEINDNASYFNYGDPLYAVADGTVVILTDGRPENHGVIRDVPMSTMEDFKGNYLVLDIGNGRYAHYVHCIPGSFRVKVGDKVTEGEVLARLGNSGNSGLPHLHFQITDGPDTFFSHGLPIVLKEYTKVGSLGWIRDFPGADGLIPYGPGLRQTPLTFIDALMEQTSVFDVH